MTAGSTTTIERFIAKVAVQPNGCWTWTGSLDGKGLYSSFWDGERTRVAHIYAYEFFVGPVPEGLQLDHFRCDDTACVNPFHLRPVTCRENLLRGDTITARNLSRTHCPHGHPYDEKNTYIYKGERRCRACRADAEARRRSRRLACNA